MSIFVYSQLQELSATPSHETTRRLSTLILKAGLARQIGQNAIRLTTELPWVDVKRMARAHVDPLFVRLSPLLPTREYPDQLACMAEAFQRCMRYPVELAKDQRSWPYSFAVLSDSSSIAGREQANLYNLYNS